MLEFLNEVDAFVWGPPLLCLLVGTGIWLTIRLNMIQVLRLPLALKLIFKAKNEGHGDVDSFKALCTALAATVGTGNIVGVATAIKAGGPGALFWMWMAHFLAWQPSMPKVFWLLNIVLLTLTAISAAARCTILKKALAGNTARWQFSSR